jgi:hypothetical protein
MIVTVFTHKTQDARDFMADQINYDLSDTRIYIRANEEVEYLAQYEVSSRKYAIPVDEITDLVIWD